MGSWLLEFHGLKRERGKKKKGLLLVMFEGEDKRVQSIRLNSFIITLAISNTLRIFCFG